VAAPAVPINLFAQKNKKFPLYGALGKSGPRVVIVHSVRVTARGVVGGHLRARSPMIFA